MTLIEAAEYVYTAWMGGTMNEVRDGMNNLGEVLEAIKNEPVLPGMEQEANKVAWRDFVPVDAIDAAERYGKWKIVSNEPASKELDKEVVNFLLVNRHRILIPVDDAEYFARHFINWYKQRVTESILAAYEKGRYDMRDKLMKEAIDVTIANMMNAMGEDNGTFGRLYICVDENNDNRYDPKLYSKAKLLFKED